MVEKSSAAFGIFSDRLATENAIETLKAAGFRSTDISSLFPDNISTQKQPRIRATRALESAVKGAGAGALIGCALGWLAAIGAVSFPGQSSVLATSALVTALISLVIGAAAGSLIGALVGRRIPRYMEHYEGRVRRGDILVSVHCDDPLWAKKAMLILRRTGAEDVAFTSEVTTDFMTTERVVRPVRERTVAPSLRLVVNHTIEREKAADQADETLRTEVRKKSAS